jgi:hypothetical protein
MSSRLAGMKFMQRGSAASPPASPMEPAAKKQRLSSGGFNSSPAQSPRSSDNDALEQAAAAQELKRAEAVAREGAMKGETKWYLSVQPRTEPVVESPLRIVSAGFSTLDAADRRPEPDSDEDEEEEEEQSSAPHMPGRISFGKFGRTEKKKPAEAEAEDSSEEDDSDDPDGEHDREEDLSGVDSLIAHGRKQATARIRAERKEQKKADQAAATRLAEKRRAKELDLNRPASISKSPLNKNSMANMVCYNCNEKGHPSRDCPRKRTQRPSKLRQSH